MTNGFERNLAFFCAGAFIGGAALALYTPVTGRRMRRILRHKAEEYTNQLTEVKDTLLETGSQLRHQGERLVRNAEKLLA